MTSIFVSIWLIRTSILEWKGYMFFTIQMGTWKLAKLCCYISSKMKKSTQKEAKKRVFWQGLCFVLIAKSEIPLKFFFPSSHFTLWKFHSSKLLFNNTCWKHAWIFPTFFPYCAESFTAMQLPPTNGPNLNVCQTSWEDSHVMEVFAFSNTSVRVSLFTPTELCRKGSFQWKV